MAESSGAWDTSQEDEAGGAVVNDSIEKLFYAWRTEVNAPDILPFKQELVEEMQELLKNQEVGNFATFKPDNSLTRLSTNFLLSYK